MRRAPALALLATAATLIGSTPVRAQVEARLADLRLATAVRLALVDDVRTRPLDVRVVARGGGVEVSGDVPAAQRRTVDEVARGVRGVRVVGGLGDLTSGGATDVAAPPVRVAPRPAEADPPASDPPTSGAASGDREAGVAYHTVERGDTLFSLARRYDTTVDAILALNGQRAPDIRVGQRLRVR